MPDIAFTVVGMPAPGGSKVARVVMAGGQPVMKAGRPVVAVRDAAKGNATWKNRVAAAAAQAHTAPPLEGPLEVSFRFTVARPKGHYGTGRNAGKVRPTAPRWPTTKPDTTKLIRSCEDACTGILWRDDSQIVRQTASKDYGDRPGVRIEIWRLEASCSATSVD